MSGLTDILGSLIQAQLSPSGNERMRNTIGAGGPSSDSGLSDILGNIGGALSGMKSDAPGASAGNTQTQGNTSHSGGILGELGDLIGGASPGSAQTQGNNSQSGGILGGLGDILGGGAANKPSVETTGGGFGGLGNVLGGVLGEVGRSLGNGNKVAAGGLGALIGSLFGGGGSSVKGAMGGGTMALLAALAYSALKKAGSAPAQAPLGLLESQTDEQKVEIEQEADLAIRAMINAAKADGHIDQEEMQRIIGQLQKDGIDEEERQQVIAEMQKPMDLNGLLNAAKGNQQVAAQVYIASLLAIEVDTEAERNYMKDLAFGLDLPDQAISHIETAMGMR